MIITPPKKEDYPEFYHTYVKKVESTDLLDGLRKEMSTTLTLLGSLDDAVVNHRYEKDKWNIKEVMIHMIDAERVFSYRALRFGRHDTTPLAGFDQNEFGARVLNIPRKMDSILDEYRSVRQSTLSLYENFKEEDLNVTGMASDAPVTVRAIGYITLGHNIHHRLGIESNYLSK